MMASGWKHRLATAAWLTASILVLAALVAIALKYWVLPDMGRRRFLAACERFWDGQVEVDHVEVDPAGSVQLDGVRLLDNAGRLHASAERIIVLVRDPLGNPVVTNVATTGVDVFVHRIDGEYYLPVRKAPSPESDSFDLQSLQVRGRALSVVEITTGETAGEPVTTGGPRAFRLDIHRENDRYVAEATLPPPNAGEDREGLLSASLSFQGSGESLNHIKGDGLLEMRRINARKSRLTEDVFELLNGELGRGQAASDLTAAFTLDWPVVTVEDAVLADEVSVMRVEQGGWINLANGKLDLYLVTLRLRGVSSLLESIPVVSLATSVSNKLTRLHITGTLEERKITKEPIKDVAAATKIVLAETLRVGGQVGPSIGGAFGQMLRVLPRLPELTSQPASAPAQP